MAAAPERIGFTLPLAEGLTPAEQLAMVRHAERLGYDSVWLGESWGREVFTTLAWILTGFLAISGLIGVLWAPRNEGKSLERLEAERKAA